MKTPKAVTKALKHVRERYPGVCMVVFNSDQRWQYFDEDFRAPTFGKEINVGILEDAMDSVESLPAVYELHEAEANHVQ